MFSDYRLLPKYLSSTRGVFNPENQDNKSFGYAIVSHFHPGDRLYNTPEDLEHWMVRFKQHGLDKINYPVRLTDVEKLEEQLRLRINVFTLMIQKGSRVIIITSLQNILKRKSIYYTGANDLRILHIFHDYSLTLACKTFILI